MVIQKKGGPRSLYCTRCHVWFANTANFEMRKEGYIAYSHTCGVKRADEISDEEWLQKKNK